MKKIVSILALVVLVSSTAYASPTALFIGLAKEALKIAATEAGKTAIEEFKKLFNHDKEIAKKGNPQLTDGTLIKDKRSWTISPGKLRSKDLAELAKVLKSIDNDIDQVIKVNGSDNVVVTTQSGNVTYGTHQEIFGDNPVTSFNQQGGITAHTINISVNEWEEIRKIADEQISSHDKGKDIENAELKRRLAEIHKVEFDVLPKEADDWAKFFINSLPLRKDKFKTIQSDKRIAAEKDKTELPFIFDYIFQSLDAKMSALQKRIPDIKLERPDNYELIVDLDVSKSIHTYLTRRITFPNNHSIELILHPGIIEKGVFKSYPELDFIRVANNQKDWFFRCRRSSGGYARLGLPVMDDISYGNSLDDEFKDRISRQFDKLIEIVFLEE